MSRNQFSSLFLAFILVLGISATLNAQTHRFATFNIRWDNPNDVGNLWKDRLPHVISLIRFHQIGLFGTQETLVHQMKQINEGLGYLSIGVGRDDGMEKGEFSPIHYDPTRYQLEASGTFWLSPTPETPSKGWDAALNRICTWGRFKSKEGTRFYVFNVHYDHIGQQAREKAASWYQRKFKKSTRKIYL